MRILFCSIFCSYFFGLCVLFIINPTYAQSTDEKIATGLKSYQSGKFEDAKTNLSEALQANLSDSFVVYNLGLAEYKLGNVGHALGYWNRALFLNPSLKEAKQAIEFSLSKLVPAPEKPEIDGAVDVARYRILPYLPLHLVCAFTLISLFVFWRRAIREIKARTLAEKEGLIKPGFSVVTGVFCFLFLVFGFLNGLKFYELSQHRAIVVNKKVEVKAGPGNEQVALFDLPEGSDVIVKETQNDWFKILTNNEKIGWVERASLYSYTD